MKSISVLILAMCLISVSNGYAQKHLMDSEVPQDVMKVFKQMRADAADCKWTENTENYSVEYKSDDFPYKSFFTFDAKWIRTESEIDSEELPDAVLQPLKAQQGNKEIGSVKQIDLPERKKVYLIELYDANYNNLQVMYDANGKQLK